MPLTLSVKVVPGAKADCVVRKYGLGIKIQVTAPPERGKANAVVRILADTLRLRPDQVQVFRGHATPRKILSVEVTEALALSAWIAGLPQ